jgi:pyridoxine/pyridoxamine 5'-phosphate oxidase
MFLLSGIREAHEGGVKDPSVVCVATATRCGAPSCRMVLLKEFDERGFVIYTNSLSRKGREMDNATRKQPCVSIGRKSAGRCGLKGMFPM